jgi:alkylation response protein AidB-like acyl-CoA dehydrogenase
MIGLEERHQSFQDRIRTFCEDVIDPAVAAYEETREFPHDVIDDLAAEGIHGTPYPTEYGGEGRDVRSMVIVQEEVARAWKTLAGQLNVAWTLVGWPIFANGAEWQRDEWLRELVTGEWIGALSMTEPGAGSDVTGVTTTADRDGDEWVLNGHKHWTSYGSVADFLMVLARTGEGRHDLSLIGVPTAADAYDGEIEFVRNIPNMEGGSSIDSEIEYHDVRVPAENVVGEVDEGFAYAMEALDLGRIGVAGQGVGVARGAFEAARDFADEREQFGRPIREFQGIGFKLADMKMDIEAARLLAIQAAAERDAGRDATGAAAKAKTFATDVAMDVTTEAVQVHGARGYSKDYPVERYMREAKGLQIYEGTNEVNRVVITDELYS